MLIYARLQGDVARWVVIPARTPLDTLEIGNLSEHALTPLGRGEHIAQLGR